MNGGSQLCCIPEYRTAVPQTRMIVFDVCQHMDKHLVRFHNESCQVSKILALVSCCFTSHQNMLYLFSGSKAEIQHSIHSLVLVVWVSLFWQVGGWWPQLCWVRNANWMSEYDTYVEARHSVDCVVKKRIAAAATAGVVHSIDFFLFVNQTTSFLLFSECDDWKGGLMLLIITMMPRVLWVVQWWYYGRLCALLSFLPMQNPIP